MRHQIVTRIVLSLAVLWTAAVVLFAWGTTRLSPVPERPDVATAASGSEALFASHCAMCHDAETTGERFRSAADREAAAGEFRVFLEDHYGPSVEENALIVSHLMRSGDR